MIFGDGLAPFSTLFKHKLHLIKGTQNKSIEGALICILSNFFALLVY